MQTYDMLMTLVLVAATLFGFWKGMAWQIASLASLVVSYFVAFKFADQLAPMISSHAPWNKFVAMLAIYVATSFVIWSLFRLISGAIDRVKLDSFDHQMGGLFGLAKGVLVCIAITFFAVTILPQAQKDTIIASRTGEYIVKLLDKTHSVVPPEIHDVIHPYVERIEQRLDPHHQPTTGQEFQALWPRGEDAPSDPPAWPAQASSESTDVAPSAWSPPTSPPDSTEQPPWPTPPQTADRTQESSDQASPY
jgi:membrane protein required for colicin V production